MRNKPAKLYLLIGPDDKPYMRAGKAKDFNSKGKAIKVARQIYDRTAKLYSVVQARLVHNPEAAQ